MKEIGVSGWNCGGEGGIRTPVTRKDILDFESSPYPDYNRKLPKTPNKLRVPGSPGSYVLIGFV